MSIGIRLGGPDTASIRFLDRWPFGLFFAPGVDNSNPKITEFLVQQYFEQGAALFGRETAESINDVRIACGGSLSEMSDEGVHQLVHYYVARVRNYAHIATMDQAAIRTARVCGCAQSECFGREGRRLSIFEMVHRIAWMQTLSHAQYEKKVFGRNLGFPPFNLICQCRLEGVIAGLEDTY